MPGPVIPDEILWATTFADWVFRLTRARCEGGVPGEAGQRLARGVQCELDLEAFHHWAGRASLDGRPEDWKLLCQNFAGGSEGRETTTYNADSLKIGGKPMRCAPDLVLENARTGRIVIVERKSTSRDFLEIPDRYSIGGGLWENNFAQLWCYSHISEWADRRPEQMLLALEYYPQEYEGRPPLIKRLPFRPNELDEKCGIWFQQYRADCEVRLEDWD